MSRELRAARIERSRWISKLADVLVGVGRVKERL